MVSGNVFFVSPPLCAPERPWSPEEQPLGNKTDWDVDSSHGGHVGGKGGAAYAGLGEPGGTAGCVSQAPTICFPSPCDPTPPCPPPGLPGAENGIRAD